LANLRHLYLANNRLTSIPDSIRNLIQITMS
jgi:Leucine-rich repeat (LRR) protein